MRSFVRSFVPSHLLPLDDPLHIRGCCRSPLSSSIGNPRHAYLRLLSSYKPAACPRCPCCSFQLPTALLYVPQPKPSSSADATQSSSGSTHTHTTQTKNSTQHQYPRLLCLCLSVCLSFSLSRDSDPNGGWGEGAGYWATLLLNCFLLAKKGGSCSDPTSPQVHPRAPLEQ